MLALAGDLEQQAKATAEPEAFLRTALGRAYFSAYCHARNYARDFQGYKPSSESDDHGKLREHLKRSRRKGDADRLDRLRQWRNKADYEDVLPFDPATVIVSALSEAKLVFQSLTPPKPPS
jgi:hypothetical protein